MTKVLTEYSTIYSKLPTTKFSCDFFSPDDDDVARKISDKLRVPGVHGISFCNIAKKAQELGRKKLAIKVSPV